MNLTVRDFFGKYGDGVPASSHLRHNAVELATKVNALIAFLEGKGILFPINPITKSIVSGETLGGFRPQDCPIGAPNSAHKQAMAVDLYDPKNEIDTALQALQKDVLAQFGLYFEHYSATPHWSHWSTRKPKSGRRFFYP